ncbi:MAG: hypothetical protein H7Y86_08540 [Rhizobacter sp.]|nr:hypothetical protein [Ferruginibacter sp.]
MAKNFLENGKLLAEPLKKLASNDGLHAFTQTVVPATNISFALELSLKGLLLLSDEKKVFSHKLKSLFDLLPDELKDEIYIDYGNNAYADDLVSILMVQCNAETYRTQHNPLPTDSKDLIQYTLDKHDDAFVVFRYLFEFGKPTEEHFEERFFNYKLMAKLASSCINVLDKKRKN